MADDRTTALELKIAELESQIRRVSPSAVGGLDKLAAFSAGSCTNECTAACTIGCTKGCTGSCVTQEFESIVSQPARTAVETVDAGIAGAQLFNQLAKRG